MPEEYRTASTITLIVIMHAREPFDEATLWMVPGDCTREVLFSIAADTAPVEAVKVFGPSKFAAVKEMVANLSTALTGAAVKVRNEMLAGD